MLPPVSLKQFHQSELKHIKRMHEWYGDAWNIIQTPENLHVQEWVPFGRTRLNAVNIEMYLFERFGRLGIFLFSEKGHRCGPGRDSNLPSIRVNNSALKLELYFCKQFLSCSARISIRLGWHCPNGIWILRL